VKVQVKEWGDSQGVRIPGEILEDAGISMNEMLNIAVINGAIILSKTFRHKTLEERTAEFGEGLDLDGEYDWGEPVGREVW
jgi:antitoxin MazE